MQSIPCCGDKLCPCQDGCVCNHVSYPGSEAMMLGYTVHERNLRTLPCVISEMKPVTLHHCHSGSMAELGPEFPNPGWSEKQNPFLQIPIHERYHIGDYGIDSGMGVHTWEDLFGKQVDLLNEINGLLIYDIWEQARLWTSNRNWI